MKNTTKTKEFNYHTMMARNWHDEPLISFTSPQPLRLRRIAISTQPIGTDYSLPCGKHSSNIRNLFF